ncbi:MAG TPA: LuxR C-terminal-related transcriptional regulator [Saprospiraceae bacterium]|nr:LuxR C-terminal-related transcriptional regulator [Saprospiraceae bacterium]
MPASPRARQILNHFRLWKEIPITSRSDQFIALLRSPFFEQFVFHEDSLYFVIDHATGTYDFVSSNWDNLTGWPSQRMIDEGVSFSFGLVHPADTSAIVEALDSYRDYIRHLIARGGAHNVMLSYTYRLRAADGRYLLCRQETIPIEFGPEGDFTHGFGIVRILGEAGSLTNNIDLTIQLVSQTTSLAVIRQTMSQPEVHLTDRELEVLSYLSSGLKSKEIARRTFISEQTVKSHRKHLLEKTETHNAAELTAYAVRLGLV